MRYALVVSTMAISIIVGHAASQENVVTLRNHRASIVAGDKTIDVPCDQSFVDLLIKTAQEAGASTPWERQSRPITFTNSVTFSTEDFGPYKAYLGSMGFSGLRAITVEIDDPYRILINDADDVYASKLSKDSSLLLAHRVLWQTARSLK